MIGMHANRLAYYLADSTLPFYVELEFDASPFTGLFGRSAIDPVAYKREMLLFKMFAVRVALEASIPAGRRDTIWSLYLAQMERILDLNFPRHKTAIKEDLNSAMTDYAAICSDLSPGSARRVGERFAGRLGLSPDDRLAPYAANVFLRKSARAKRYLSRRIWF